MTFTYLVQKLQGSSDLSGYVSEVGGARQPARHLRPSKQAEPLCRPVLSRQQTSDGIKNTISRATVDGHLTVTHTGSS
jgi:hypothetical protein